jgi:NAD(P)-dependent dehydrogenase (short-subunit alcohol dehydrogenase family)
VQLDGKVVLITGATGGLGHAVTPAFLNAGARVITVDRHAGSRRAENQLAFAADVTDEADVRRVVADVIREAGRIDALVNLVGGFAMGRLTETDTSLWQKMLSLNVTSAFFLSKAVLPHMMERRSGRILHIAARAALDPFAGAAAYLVSKSALVALIRVLAVEVANSGVTVNGVLPTTIDTPANRKSMPDTDPSKWAKPESIAQLLIYLASGEASAINGALLPIGIP